MTKNSFVAEVTFNIEVLRVYNTKIFSSYFIFQILSMLLDV